MTFRYFLLDVDPNTPGFQEATIHRVASPFYDFFEGVVIPPGGDTLTLPGEIRGVSVPGGHVSAFPGGHPLVNPVDVVVTLICNHGASASSCTTTIVVEPI